MGRNLRRGCLRRLYLRGLNRLGFVFNIYLKGSNMETNRYGEQVLSIKEKLFAGCALFLIIFGIIALFTTFGTVPAGHKGVKLRFGAVVGTIPEGFYAKIPLVEGVKKVSVQTQKLEVKADAASKDLQTVTADVAINYNLEYDKVADLYKETGLEYESKVMSPSVEEAVKATTAQYTAEQLITSRQEVNDKIFASLKSELEPYGIKLQQLNIVNFSFSASFDTAIEAKVTAEQNALAAKNKLQQVQYEADQKIAEAKGKAEALRVESEALRNNPDVLQLRALEKWNGVLPVTITSGAVPFIDITK